MKDEYLLDIYEGSKSFVNGIYIKYTNASGIFDFEVHPCGWDFISFDYVNEYNENILNHAFELYEISNGIYEKHPFEDYTLKDILEVIGDKWSFELSDL